MDNLLPPFSRIITSDPASTQKHNYFSTGYTKSTPPPHHPSYHDLISHANSNDHIYNPDDDLHQPVNSYDRPRDHDPLNLNGLSLPYPETDEFEHEQPPINEVMRGRITSTASNSSKFKVAEDYEDEVKEIERVESDKKEQMLVSFIHLGGRDEDEDIEDTNADDERRSETNTNSNTTNSDFGQYDLFIKGSNINTISNYEVPPHTKLSFTNNTTKPLLKRDNERNEIDGVTFTLVKDDFSHDHFKASMRTTTIGKVNDYEDGDNDNNNNGDNDENDNFFPAPPQSQSQSTSPTPTTPPNPLEFYTDFDLNSPFGLELTEVNDSSSQPCIIVNGVVNGSQAAGDYRIASGAVVLGVDGSVVCEVEEFYRVVEETERVNGNGSGVVRVYFMSGDRGDTRGSEGYEEEAPAEDVFLTGVGIVDNDDDDDNNLQADRIFPPQKPMEPTTYLPPPPIPTNLPLRLNRSVNDANPITLYFQNHHTSMTLRLSWIDYNGELVPRKELYPGEAYTERSFTTHPWVCTAVDGVFAEDEDYDRTQSSSSSSSLTKQTSPALIIRLGDLSITNQTSYNILWNPTIRTISFLPMTSLAPGKIRPFKLEQREYPDNMNGRVRYAKEMVIKELKNARLDGVGGGRHKVCVGLFGNGSEEGSVFDS